MNKQKQWCKIFQIGEYQILVAKEGFDDYKEKYGVSTTSFIGGDKMTFTMSFVQEHDADSFFDEFNDVKAELFFNQTVFPLFGNP